MLSHRLLLKSGYISQLSAGIFSFTPMGWRVINNIKKIINDEMKKYRKDLRDLPASNSDPSKIVFPTKPE